MSKSKALQTSDIRLGTRVRIRDPRHPGDNDGRVIDDRQYVLVQLDAGEVRFVLRDTLRIIVLKGMEVGVQG